MLGELLADGFGPARIGLDERDVRRRRWRRVAEEFLLHIDAAHDGRGVHAIGRGGEERGLGEQAAAFAFGQRHLAKLDALQRWQAVVQREFAIQKGVVGGEEFAWRQIFSRM